MPEMLRMPDGSYMRQTDIERIVQMLFDSRCVEITGFSNVGKSSLMRMLSHADVWLHQLGEEGGSFLPVYIDCNRILEMSEQGFYELVLRCLLESSHLLAGDQELRNAYESLVAPASAFQVPLSFSNGLSAALQKGQHNIVLLFDEFDEPFQQLDARVFLNLRAKKDRYRERLVFVTATVWPLAELWPDEHSGEFGELFAHNPWHLGPLHSHDVERYVRHFADRNNVILSSEDVDFIYHWSGGHPGYLEGISKILGQAMKELDRPNQGQREGWMLRRRLAGEIQEDSTLLTESEKIWRSCMPEHQEVLRRLFSKLEADDASQDHLMKHHILVNDKEQLRAFARLFAEYVLAHQTDAAAAGGPVLERREREYFVGERRLELSKSEYNLMNLLHENRNRTVEKYEIVVHVWGENSLGEVDDARIEKLVSRLRQKAEPDPASPVLIVTIRGRGYRLNVD